MQKQEQFCGYVAIVGKPNVGKSTLLNTILGQKISITSRKPQTTRHNILGIKTVGNSQTIYVDTPGLHKNKHHTLNKFMNRSAVSALMGVDIVIFMVEETWNEADELVLENLRHLTCPVILVINKTDIIKNKNELLPYIEKLHTKFTFNDIIPISAKTRFYVDKLEELITKLLPKNNFYFAEDQITDRSERFLVAEIIREKLTRLLGQELPYAITVEIEQFKEEEYITRIAAIIYVERESQKAIVIGNKGKKLKEISTKARLDIEKLLNKKVFLEVWVKVKQGWADDERSLQSLGYKEF